MSIQIFADNSSASLNFVNNLKVSIAIEAYKPELKFSQNDDNNEKFGLVLSANSLKLIEPNSIVKYLYSISSKESNAFESTEEIRYEEKFLHEHHVSKATDAITIPDFPKVELTPSQIIVFASSFPLQPQPSTQWFNEFSKLSEVVKGVEEAKKVTKLERPKAKNTGAQRVKADYIVKKQAANIIPKADERNILITSALPYVNNVPHLGNIVGSVLSADIYSRYAKNRNYNTLFICGTDEYGTATETKALEEKVSPRELCTKYHKIHKEVYDWFQIGFDYFGRTTTEKQTVIAQDIFMKLYENGFLEEKVMDQLYCEEHKGFLADRYVEGICPKCAYEDARGDQCDKCGNLLNPFELIKPRCKLDNSTPIPKKSNHIFLSLDKLEPELKEWVIQASTEGNWSKNSKNITNSWLKEGLLPRCITRDLVWGTPVPLEGFKEKVLYVWFDATIGYVSITANYTDDWQKWWKDPSNIQLYQFMGKDNVPFHTVVFPATQIGTNDKWTKLYHLNTTEYLQYEGGKFSKSRGVGVFGNNAKDTGVSPSVWRYYLASIRPETSDSQFSWTEFVTKNNSELLANLGNFVNRLVKFIGAKYNGVIPQYNPNLVSDWPQLSKDVNELLSNYNTAMEAVQLRRGLEIAMALSSRGNLFLQDNKLDNSLYTNLPDKSDAVMGVGINLIYLVAAVISPFMPETAEKIYDILNVPALSITNEFVLAIEAGHCIGNAQYLFKRIDEKMIDVWRGKYGGQQQK